MLNTLGGINVMLGDERSKLLQSILNEFRVSIIAQLLSGNKNIAGLVRKLGVGRSKLCYHLNILENAGILTSKYVIIKEAHSKGKAGRFYSINRDKLTNAVKVIDDFKKEVGDLGF